MSALCKRFKSNSSFRRIVKIFLRILTEGTGPVGFDSLPEALEPLLLPFEVPFPPIEVEVQQIEVY